MKSSQRSLLVILVVSILAFAGCAKKDTMAANTASDTANASAPAATDTANSSATAGAMTMGANSANTAPTASSPDTSATPTMSATSEGRVVEVTANDTMKFSVGEIKAKPGEKMSVTLKNIGTLPKVAMGHNFVLLKSADAVQPFVNEAPQAGATDYIPASQKDQIIASTKLLGPGESDTANFKAPVKPGRYPFLCSFPGHYQVGMKGELVVE